MNKQRQNRHFNDIDVVILCGGQGTRIKPVIGNKPKVLADINGKPFLEILINQLVLNDFKKIILSVGYLKEQIKDYIQNVFNNNQVEISFSEEETMLGTGGAVKKVKDLIKNHHFLVVNGDTYFPIDFNRFFANYLSNKALVSAVIARISDVSDYGSVKLDDNGRIISFNEKSVNENDLVNAGMYFMSKEIFNLMPSNDVFSLEYDLFPKILNNKCHGFIGEGELIDIGTPEKYEKAKIYFKI
ncbi:MAG: nucleotidyltransferase family protein [Patescibacteria group bacterium]|nr:nucleotidyltransferase family protein [Patescibacteria group bacterium]